MRVAVIGGHRVDEEIYRRARELGRTLGRHGHDIVCGGYGGVMEAACRGARETGAHTLGILKGTDRHAGNEHLDTAVATGLGDARNWLVVVNGDAVIAVDGGAGTLSELGLGLVAGKPVAGIDTHDLTEFPGFEAVDSVSAAVASVERRV